MARGPAVPVGVSPQCQPQPFLAPAPDHSIQRRSLNHIQIIRGAPVPIIK